MGPATYARNFDKEMNLILRRDAERAFIKKYSFEKWMEVFGKNYLDEYTPERKRKS